MSSLIQYIIGDDGEGLKKALKSHDVENEKMFDNETLLYRSAQIGSIKCCRVLLDNGSDPNVKTELFEETPLQVAIQEDKEEVVDLLLKNKASVNSLNAEGESALFTAVRFNRINIFKKLLDNGANPQFQNINGDTLIDVAQLMHASDALEILKQKGENTQQTIKEPKPEKRAPRHFKGAKSQTIEDAADLVKEDDINKLKEMINSSDILNQQMFDEYTLLHVAAESNAIKCMSFLIETGLNVNAQTKTFKETPLQMAAAEGNQECVDMLIAAGADVNLENAEGENALFASIRSQNVNIFENILNHGVDPNSKNLNGYTLFQVASMYHQFFMAQTLISCGADVTLGPHNSYIIAYEADEKELATIVKLKNPALVPKAFKIKQQDIIENPEKMNKIRSTSGAILKHIIADDSAQLGKVITDADDMDSLLSAAIDLNSTKCVKLLLTKGANVNLQEKNFRLTPLMSAIDHGFIPIFKAIMEHKPDLELVDSAGETAIFHAIHSKKMECIVDIINAGADVTIENNKGETPSIVALQTGNEIALQMLMVKDPDALDRNPNFSLFAAIESGKDNLFLKALKTRPDLNAHNSRDYTPFQVATILHRFSMAQELASRGADITLGPRNSYSIAVAMNEPLLAVLVKRANPELANKEGKKEEILGELEENSKLHSSFGKALSSIISDNDAELVKIINEEGKECFDLESLLHAATGLNSVKCISVLAKNGAKINFKEANFHETALHIACSHKFIEAINELIKNGADPNATNSQGETPIFYAVRENDAKIVGILLEAGASSLTRSQNEETPIKIARENGYKDIVDLLTKPKMPTVKEPTKKPPKSPRRKIAPISSPLAELIDKDDSIKLNDELKKGQNSNQKINSENFTLLHYAAKTGATKCATLLLCYGANVDPITTKRETPLHVAISYENKEIVEVLLSKGADYRLENSDGENTLFYAIRSQNKEIFQRILALFDDVDFLNNVGRTPLVVAVEMHCKDFVKELIKHGAKITQNAISTAREESETDICSIMLRTNPLAATEALETLHSQRGDFDAPPPELFRAIKSKNAREVRTILESNGIELNNDDVVYGVPLFKAIEAGSLDCVKVLVMYGADVNFWSREYPLFVALRSGEKAITDFLIENGADINAETQDGETAIFAAVKSKNAELVKMMIEKGADVNQTNVNNLSPLYIATGMKAHDVVKVLLSNGANPNTVGLPPLKLAHDLHDQQSARLLSTHGARSKIFRQPRTTRQHKTIASLSPIRRSIKKEFFEDGRCCVCNRHDNLLKLLPCGHRPVCRACMNAFVAHRSTCPVCQMSFYATK